MSDQPPASGAGEPALDVTPRPPAARRRRRGIVASLALVAVAAGLVVIAVNALGHASLFFLNADEAVERRDDLGDDRFRLQGTVVDGSVEETLEGVTFRVTYGGAEVDVVHRGDPPELFQPDIPVVLEGHWDGTVYASDRIMVRHTSEYEADHGDRLDDAEQRGGYGERDGGGDPEP